MFRTTAGIFLVLILIVANGCCVQRCETGGQASSPFLHGGEGLCDSACGPQRSRGLIGCLRKLLTCGSGCGELYVDEWLNDPPDCCDPCDNCGNWIGPHGSNMGQPRPLHRGNLWGQRFEGNCCSECGMIGPEAGYHHGDGFHHDGIEWDPLAGKAPPRSEVAPALAGAAPRTKPKHRQVSHTDR
jgi:hypothetical protein